MTGIRFSAVMPAQLSSKAFAQAQSHFAATAPAILDSLAAFHALFVASATFANLAVCAALNPQPIIESADPNHAVRIMEARMSEISFVIL